MFPLAIGIETEIPDPPRRGGIAVDSPTRAAVESTSPFGEGFSVRSEGIAQKLTICHFLQIGV